MQHARAQHRRERQRNEPRDDDGDRDRHRELAKDPADHAAHQQHRNEHGDQRKVIEIMVKPISRAPLSAASNGRIPPSTWRTMFSSMTIASSTTNPTDSVSASSVMLLIENPNTYMATHVPISDTGTASAGMTVAETDRRNRKITRITRTTAMKSVSCTFITEARIETERSISTCMRIEG